MEELARGKLDPKKLRQNIDRVRGNIKLLRETIGDSFGDRPIIGFIRDLRKRVKSGVSPSEVEYGEDVESQEKVAESPSPSDVETPTHAEELPPRLIERKPLELEIFKRPRLISSLRKYGELLTREKELELKYQEARLKHFTKLMESPPPKPEKEEKRGVHY